MEPLFSFPTVLGTANTPYGLMSPLLGTVDETVLTVGDLAFAMSWALAIPPPKSSEAATAVVSTVMDNLNFSFLIEVLLTFVIDS